MLALAVSVGCASPGYTIGERADRNWCRMFCISIHPQALSHVTCVEKAEMGELPPETGVICGLEMHPWCHCTCDLVTIKRW